jgi:CRISP-associated protein Cas1
VSFHIVSIDAPQCSLSCKDGQLVCRVEGEPVRSLPLEDVASIIITSFSASLHSHLLLEAARHGVALILCEAFKPASILLPANRSTDTLLTRAVLSLPEKARAAMWQKTVDAKCANQLSLIEHIAPEDASLPALRRTAMGKQPHKEAVCAKVFWGAFGRACELGDAQEGRKAGTEDADFQPSSLSNSQESFTRERSLPGLNALLNYGYAVLLSTVLQKLFAVGLDPTFGLSHATRERSTPLAYDIMEPFRPCVDWRVFQWVKNSQLSTPTSQLEVSKDFRKWVTQFPLARVEWGDLALSVEGCVEGVVRTFRRAVMEAKPAIYRPWIQRSTKWAG